MFLIINNQELSEIVINNIGVAFYLHTGLFPFNGFINVFSIFNCALRREDLDISKKKVQTGEVSVHKEVSTENKTLVVPVTREELVIEKNVLRNKKPGEPDKTTIRIPVKTEEIDIVKHPVTLENVSVYKRKLQKNQRIKATVKTERLRLESKGDPKMKDLRKYRVTGK